MLILAQRKLEKWVAPLVGAWIEITSRKHIINRVCVAPLVGAWIEISNK